MTQYEQSSLLSHLDSEDMRLELKTCSDGRLPKDIWEVISAFSNTEGGRIMLGVEPNGSPINLSSNDVDKLQRDILTLCQNTFNYPITPTVFLLGSVVVVDIPVSPAIMRPIYSIKRGITQGSYVRIGSSNMKMSDEIRNQFAVAARGGAEIIEYTDIDYMNCFDDNLIDNYVSIINKERDGVYDNIPRREILYKLKAINKDDHPTLFGILSFCKGYQVQELTAPTANIAVTQYRGSTKVTGDPTVTYIDYKEFNGNAIEQFNATFSFIKSKLPISGVIDDSGKRRDYLIIPEVAIREALANAIAHRDYSTYSSRIQVSIYSDRVEIVNPGTSLVPIEDLDNTSSVSRNPLLMSFLKDHHVTEQLARGIRTIKESLRSAGLAEPIFENNSTSFKITLSSSAFFSKHDHDWLRQFRLYKLNEHQLAALTHLKNASGGINNSEYRSINNMASVGDDKKATNELNRLVKLKLILPVGDRKKRRYFINNDILS